MLMRLANAEEYNYVTESFNDVPENTFVFVDFIQDHLNLPHFQGAEYHNSQRYFAVFLARGFSQPFPREEDTERFEKPFAVYFSGHDDDIGAYVRFETEEQAMEWIDLLYPHLDRQPDWKMFF